MRSRVLTAFFSYSVLSFPILIGTQKSFIAIGTSEHSFGSKHWKGNERFSAQWNALFNVSMEKDFENFIDIDI